MIEKLKGNPSTCWNDITDKINELIDYINSPGLECRELGTGTAPNDMVRTSISAPAEKYPDFVKWNREAIETSVWQSFSIEDDYAVFLTIAPEDFYTIENGGKKYLFTWDEAMKLEEEVLKPNGWRLPTYKELCQLCAAYVDEDGDDDTERFMKELKVEMRGYKGRDGNIFAVGGRGCWWTSTEYSSTHARDLAFDSGYFYTRYVDHRDNGFVIRPVKVSA